MYIIIDGEVNILIPKSKEEMAEQLANFNYVLGELETEGKWAKHLTDADEENLTTIYNYRIVNDLKTRGLLTPETITLLNNYDQFKMMS